MKYVFFGTPRFAEIILDVLLRADMPPTALICNPDRPVGRKKIVTPPPTKKLITDNHPEIIVLQPDTLDAAFEQKLKTLQPDFFIVAAYAKIIPKTTLDIPTLGTLGVHPSLLPKYRGTSPIQSAILDGEKETGVTVYRMDEKIDHGEIVSRIKYLVAPTDNYESLVEKLGTLSGKLLVETVPKFMNGETKNVPQDGGSATFTKKFGTQDGFVAPEDLKDAEAGDPQKAGIIFRKIRALNPEPGVWTMRDGKRLKLFEAKIIDGAFKLIKIQEEGQKPKAVLP